MVIAPPSPDQASPVADLRLTEVASGVDTLYLSGRAVLNPELLGRLEAARQLAEGTSVAIPFEFGGESLLIAAHGWGRYRYCLTHPTYGRIGFSASAHVPPIRIQLLSSFLHIVGPARAVEVVSQLLSAECEPVNLSVSRLDLYADFTGWELRVEDRALFVCRAGAVRTFEAEGRLTGLQFGNRSTKTVLARIYDKTADVERTGADWWFEIWACERDRGLQVHRIEFELNRQALAQFGLTGPTETLKAIGDMWSYCSGEWLTHRSPASDANRSRWPVSREWSCVQQADLVQHKTGIERLTRQLRCGSLRKLSPGLVGYIVSFAALSDTSGIDETMTALGHHLREDEIARRTPFPDRVRRRRLDSGLP